MCLKRIFIRREIPHWLQEEPGYKVFRVKDGLKSIRDPDATPYQPNHWYNSEDGLVVLPALPAYQNIQRYPNGFHFFSEYEEALNYLWPKCLTPEIISRTKAVFDSTTNTASCLWYGDMSDMRTFVLKPIRVRGIVLWGQEDWPNDKSTFSIGVAKQMMVLE